MRTNARRGSHALTMVVLTAAVSLSGRVEAQQTGSFPAGADPAATSAV